MSPEIHQPAPHGPEIHEEAARQIRICNACRYCEGFCSVFPAMFRQRAFSRGDVAHLANLCHNCRGCYYSCQFTPPHEFDLNIPAILAEARQDSWQRHAWPGFLATRFHASALAVTMFVLVALSALLLAVMTLRPDGGDGFYAHLAHGAMVAIFLPAFVLPLLALGIGVQRFWREIGGQPVRLSHIRGALIAAASLKNLDGGQGQGCNFERGDRYSDARRWLHQAVLYGFLLCFAATAVATLMHYALGMAAPYGPLSLPKLLGVPGGVLMVIGTLGLAWLKRRAGRDLGARRVWGGEMAFILLLFFVAASGLALYAATGTALVPALLVLHLGGVLALFLLIPYSKMTHGFYRLAALMAEEQRRGDRP